MQECWCWGFLVLHKFTQSCFFTLHLTKVSIVWNLHLSWWDFPFLLEEQVTSSLGLIPDSVEELTSTVGVMGTLEDCNQVTLGTDQHVP